MNWSLDLGMMSTIVFWSPPDKAPNCQNPPNAVPNPSPQILISRITSTLKYPMGDNIK
jgi:hypothetical protein